MKFDTMRSIAHNLATSLASGCSALFGIYHDVVFQKAARTPTGRLTIDVLNATVSAGSATELFPNATQTFNTALARLCQHHAIPPTAFLRLEACFMTQPQGRRFTVTMQDQTGRFVTDEYDALGARFRQLDHLGRIRRHRSVPTTAVFD